MLADIIIFILCIGLVSMVMPKDKFAKTWSLVIAAVVAYCCAKLYFWDSSVEVREVYPWIRTQHIRINLEILINSQNCYALASLLFFSFLVVLNNTFNLAETDKIRSNGIVLLNVFFMALLMSASNYVQLLTAIGMIDVLVFSAINRSDAKKNYIYGNFLADMGILSICAVVLGQGGDVSLESLENYVKAGQHEDYVVIILLLCIFIKSGLFMFHGMLTELSGLLFSRINFIIFGTTPLVGFVVLNKLKPLLASSEYAYPLLIIFSLASMLWGFAGAIAMDNIKRKGIYFAMMFWGMMYSFIAFDRSIAIEYQTALIVLAYLFNQTLMLVNKASSNEKNVSVMGDFLKQLKITGFVTLVVMAVYLNLLLLAEAWLFLVLFMLSSAVVLGQIYGGKSNADERVIAMLANPSMLLYAPVLIAALAFGSMICKPTAISAVLVVIWIGLLKSDSLHKMDFLYKKQWIQNSNLLDKAYDWLIVAPLKIVGRMMWLTVDFKLVEKTIINSVTKVLNLLVAVFQKVDANNIYSYVFFTMLGWGIVVVLWWVG